jgi:hypothetical protein
MIFHEKSHQYHDVIEFDLSDWRGLQAKPVQNLTQILRQMAFFGQMPASGLKSLKLR